MTTTEHTDTARVVLARLVKGALPFSAMSADDRRRLVASGLAVEDLHFAGYLSIHPRYAGGLNVAGVHIEA